MLPVNPLEYKKQSRGKTNIKVKIENNSCAFHEKDLE